MCVRARWCGVAHARAQVDQLEEMREERTADRAKVRCRWHMCEACETRVPGLDADH